MRGRQRNGIHIFRGIPYGANTGGEHRFIPAKAVREYLLNFRACLCRRIFWPSKGWPGDCHTNEATSRDFPVSEKERGKGKMSIIESVAAMQASGLESQSSNSPGALYFAIALVAVVLGLVVLVFIRTSGRGSPRR